MAQNVSSNVNATEKTKDSRISTGSNDNKDDNNKNDTGAFFLSSNQLSTSNTSPGLQITTESFMETPSGGRNVPSLNSPNNTVRKSFFGELKNLLTFKRKDDQQTLQTDDKNDGPSNMNLHDDGGSENEREKQNPHQQLVRRKQIFESQGDKEKDSNKVDENMATVTSKINTLQMSIKKWKNKKNTELKQERDSIAMNVYHQKLLDECVERLQTEVPYPLHIVIKEEALLVATKTHGMYKSMLGSKHKITKEAESHIAYLSQTMYKPESY